jgi:UDP-N-acetylglucosamine/UDP-N-acetylgalactosamine diphosphorylase
MVEIPDELGRQLRHYGQEHVLAFWPTLTDNQRHLLLEQLRTIDFAQLLELFRQGDQGWQLPPLDRVRPVAPTRLGGEASVRAAGEEALRRGEVAVLVVAGGQGTRLSATQPKGMFAVGPVSDKSLYQIHAEKVLALRRRYHAPIPLLVMSSPATDHQSREFFAQHQHFGLPSAEVHFFSQKTMPAVDMATGKLLLSGPDRLCLSPNGHGGVLPALRDSGLLARLRSTGVRHLFYFQVDNPLVRVADPTFLGHHLQSRAELSLKGIEKDGPTDKLGNLVEVDGRCAIIEYFLLPDTLAQARDAQGRLRFAMGSPAIHIFELAFLERVLRDATSLPFHLAKKKVPYLDEASRRVQPERENAFKFEMFIFDTFPRAERWAAVLTERAEEFAPLKNETGPDSPETVRAALSRQAAAWLRQAGAIVTDEKAAVEISPLFALDAAELKEKIKPGLRVEGRTHLE